MNLNRNRKFLYTYSAFWCAIPHRFVERIVIPFLLVECLQECMVGSAFCKKGRIIDNDYNGGEWHIQFPAVQALLDCSLLCLYLWFCIVFPATRKTYHNIWIVCVIFRLLVVRWHVLWLRHVYKLHSVVMCPPQPTRRLKLLTKYWFIRRGLYKSGRVRTLS